MGAVAGAYPMAKVLKRRSLAREQMTLRLMEERRDQGQERRMVLGPGADLPGRAGGAARIPAQGFVPIAN
jgi:hypothetical protein